MTIHIHVHRSKKTNDAAAFEESKHKRDGGGKFATTSGNAAHHAAEAKKHQSQPDTPASTTHAKPDTPAFHRVMAAHHHSNAAFHLAQAESSANYREQNLGHAQQQADLAKHHEGKMGEGDHLKPGTRLVTSHRPSPGTGVSVGPDPESENHHLVKIGNSLVSIPKSQLHASKKEAEAASWGEEAMEKAPASLASHPMYSKPDYEYLKDKGYGPNEIKAFWDRDHKAGKTPVLVNKNKPPSI